MSAPLTIFGPLTTQSFDLLIIDAPLWIMIALLGVVGIAAAWDVRTYTIPNAFPLIVLGMFVVSLPFGNYDLSVLAWHLGAGVVGFFIGYVLYIFRLMGGGDVKLFAALSLWLPLGHLFTFAAAVSLAGGVLAAVVLTGVWISRLLRRGQGNEYPPLSKTRLPYGVAIFAGTLVVALMGRV